MVRTHGCLGDEVCTMNEMNIRPPAVAGLFYPASADGLRSQVQQLLDHADSWPHDHIRAVIVPHAGYR